MHVMHVMHPCKFSLNGQEWHAHRPHLGKEAKKYQIEGVREFLERLEDQTMSKVTCKGYSARIEFDDRDNIFVGRVLGINAIIGFHGETVAELREAFEAAIDFMIEDCQANGIEPEKPASGKLMMRVSPEAHGAALIAAKASGQSLNQWAAKVLGEAAKA